jgi:hypothetical protein
MVIKEIYKDLDLYGSEILIALLKKKFKSVAYTKKSIPTPGSRCKASRLVSDTLKINRLIFHENGDITAFTDLGNLKFF